MYKTLLLVCFLFFSPVYGNEKLTIVTENFPPFQFTDKNGKLIGISAEIVRQVMDNTQLDYQIHVFPWARALKTGKSSPSTLIFSLLRTKARESSFHWLVPLCRVTTAVFTLKSRTDVIVNTLNDIAKYKIGVGRGHPNKSFLVNHGFEKNIIEVNDHNQLRRMIKHGRVDVILLLDRYVNEFTKKSVSPESQLKRLFSVTELSRDLYLAANKNVPTEIIKQVSTSYNNVKSSEVVLCHI